ncbi:sugar transferase [Cellulophaga baltica]|uniref:sugar transferase n=1 Tax=Cellulophaga TaxID=104264 RepID=UPI001C06641B|nr:MULTISPECIES: sugar transferase [Cellulophaga]MBU2996733.1 sugar transferase [Cellulophaga baltica]MDO6768129.1 sugar transferase [Cellulophaga sp. 1_MG-2023]
MSTRFKFNILERKFILVIGDIIMVLLSLYYFIHCAFQIHEILSVKTITFYTLGLILYLMLAYVLNSYSFEKLSVFSIKMLSRSIAISLLFVIIIFFVGLFYFNPYINRVNILIFYAGTPSIIIAWRYLFDNVFKFLPPVKNVLYIYDKNSKESLKEDVESINGKDNKNTFYEVKEKLFLSSKESYFNDTLLKNIDTYDAWVINVKNYNKISPEIKNCMLSTILSGKEVITYTSFYENNYEALPIKWHNDSFYEILQLQNRKIRYLHTISSFFINLILSITVGIVFFLVTPFVWFLNLFFNKGPLFYTQKRVGQYGKEFDIYKFRSMVIEAEKTGAKMAVKNDTRITPFGRILRMFRIDELPQILAVIKGDMKFIGPRPERAVFVNQLNEITPFYNIRHFIKPGITGWAQVMYKYGENLEDSIRKLEFDLFYIKNKSITLDFRIIFKTATTVLFSRGL